VARTEEVIEMRTKFWSKNLKGRKQVENLDIDERILPHILKEQDVSMWTGVNWLRTETILSPMMKLRLP
jgi:hypothetical protein